MPCKPMCIVALQTAAAHLVAAQLDVRAVHEDVAFHLVRFIQALQVGCLTDRMLVGAQVKVVAHGEQQVRRGHDCGLARALVQACITKRVFCYASSVLQDAGASFMMPEDANKLLARGTCCSLTLCTRQQVALQPSLQWLAEWVTTVSSKVFSCCGVRPAAGAGHCSPLFASHRSICVASR